MGIKLLLLILFSMSLSMSIVAESITYYKDTNLRPTRMPKINRTPLMTKPVKNCNGFWGECMDDEEEEEMGMESHDVIISRRRLVGRTFISYGALNGNNVPCNRRGLSYYNCAAPKRANPYQRACTAITNCARYDD